MAARWLPARASEGSLGRVCRSLRTSRDTLQLARRRLDRGLISELDVRQFEAEVASPAASVADFERQVAQQENALSVLVGRGRSPRGCGRSLTELVARIPIQIGRASCRERV